MMVEMFDSRGTRNALLDELKETARDQQGFRALRRCPLFWRFWPACTQGRPSLPQVGRRVRRFGRVLSGNNAQQRRGAPLCRQNRIKKMQNPLRAPQSSPCCCIISATINAQCSTSLFLTPMKSRPLVSVRTVPGAPWSSRMRRERGRRTAVQQPRWR